MSTWLNYTFHVDLVCATINTMLTDPGEPTAAHPTRRSPRSRASATPHRVIAGGRGALPQNSQGRPCNGDYVFSSGDLIEDLTHNFFLDTGARDNKLKVYEIERLTAATC